MVFSFLNRCIWTPASSGTGDFVVNAPSQNGFTPAQCASPAVVGGGYYHYFAVNGAENEEGDGQYTAGTTTLSRLTIRTSSNSGSKVSFSAAPTVFMGGPVSLDMPTVIPATANMTWYVATTGSDSNLGTSGSPFLTVQHAVNVAAGYDYKNIYTATINVADGTYAANGSAPAVTLLRLTNYSAGLYPTLNGDTATPANCVISNTSGDAVTTAYGAIWNTQGFRLKSTSGSNSDLYAYNGLITITGAMDLAGNNILLRATAKGSIYGLSQAINVSSTSFANLSNQIQGASVILDNATVTFPVGGCTVSDYVVRALDQSVFGYPTFVNGSGVVGNKFFAANNSYIKTTITRANFPGNGIAHLDNYSWYSGDLGITLTDTNGNLLGDYNVSSVNSWTFSSSVSYFQSSSTAYTAFSLENTSAGGHVIYFGTNGSANTAPGSSFILDVSTGNYPIFWDTSANVGMWAVLGWGASFGGSFIIPTIDVGISRLAAGSLAVGNGAAGDKTGSITLKDVIFTPLTVATLPSASSALKGARAFVTDELAAVAFNTVATGGGSNNVPVFCDGTTWRIG